MDLERERVRPVNVSRLHRVEARAHETFQRESDRVVNGHSDRLGRVIDGDDRDGDELRLRRAERVAGTVRRNVAEAVLADGIVVRTVHDRTSRRADCGGLQRLRAEHFDIIDVVPRIGRGDEDSGYQRGGKWAGDLAPVVNAGLCAGVDRDPQDRDGEMGSTD